MALTPSNMFPLGTVLPNEELVDTTSNTVKNIHALSEGKPTLIMFICNHCPFVIHLHNGFKELYSDYKNKDINIIAVSSNDVSNYPEDSPERMTELFKELELDIPYLYDEKQSFAKSLGAACTPDFYLFDENKALVYRGRFDESRPGNGVTVTGADLRDAMNKSLSKEAISDLQHPSLGCNIKWK